MLRLRGLSIWGLNVGLTGGVLFAGAGRLDLPMFWAFLAVVSSILLLLVFTIDPDLARERIRPAPGGRDRILRLVAPLLMVIHLAVAGLDVGRLHISDGVPLRLQVAALMGVAAGLGLAVWASSVNRFFSPVIRIQEERGHQVVTTGPYHYVRHPGYAGNVLAASCSALALGSMWSMVPAVIVALLILRRMRIEDRFLHDNLGGYGDYAATVRHRAVPGLW